MERGFDKGDTITIKAEHIKLLRKCYVEWKSRSFGAPSISTKRPYGSSTSICDNIRKITEMPSASDNWCRQKHEELLPVLQVWLKNSEQSPGTVIEKTGYGNRSWEVQDDE